MEDSVRKKNTLPNCVKMSEPKVEESSVATERAVEKAPDVEDWKIQAEAFKTQGG